MIDWVEPQMGRKKIHPCFLHLHKYNWHAVGASLVFVEWMKAHQIWKAGMWKMYPWHLSCHLSRALARQEAGQDCSAGKNALPPRLMTWVPSFSHWPSPTGRLIYPRIPCSQRSSPGTVVFGNSWYHHWTPLYCKCHSYPEWFFRTALLLSLAFTLPSTLAL